MNSNPVVLRKPVIEEATSPPTTPLRTKLSRSKGDTNIVYAQDTPPQEQTKQNRTIACKSEEQEVSEGNISPEKQSSDNLSDLSLLEEEKPKQFNLLTECKKDISLDEEKLGFSLPLPEEVAKKSPEKSDFKTPEQPKKGLKFVKPVRKRDERAKLAATACHACYGYYKAAGLDDEAIAAAIGKKHLLLRFL